MIVKKLVLAAVAAIGLSMSSHADEVWTTNAGTFEYERDIDSKQMAVIRGNGITMYIEGLAGVTTDRGAYSGIWVLDQAPTDEPGCSVDIVLPGTANQTTAYWGQMEVTFIDPDFPSIWMAQLGLCFEGPNDTIVARPVVTR